MDDETAAFATSFVAFTRAMEAAAEGGRGELTEVGQHVRDFLGVDLAGAEPVNETFPRHQVVDLDLALEAVLTDLGGERHGIVGPNRRHVDSLSDYLTNSHQPFRLGPVAYERMATGPTTSRRVIVFGLGQTHLDGVPLVWLQRGANPHYGRETYTVELLSPEPTVIDAFMTLVRQRMSEHSILRRQVISFAANAFDYGPEAALNFQPRPDVGADQVILPDGVLERVTRHVVGMGEHREALLAAGQHLKRGVLLYGPPGTGKTHLVRHLLSETPDTTAVLLSGRTLEALSQATALARAAQPAIVVLEDCDLVAEHRGGETNAALFETLEAMDGLAADADITFILTTNRADLLERALVERPGRVDLAVEIAKPDADARARLFAVYAADLLATGQLSADIGPRTAERTEGVTASFTKELIRRCVINAARAGRPPCDADVDAALDEMLSDAETLTRTLLGGEPPIGWLPAPDSDEDEDD